MYRRLNVEKHFVMCTIVDHNNLFVAVSKHLVLCIYLSFVSSRHTNVSCHVEMGSLQPPLGHAMGNFYYFTLYYCLSLTLKCCDFVAMGLHVDAVETVHVLSLGKGTTRPGFTPLPRLNLRCRCCF